MVVVGGREYEWGDISLVLGNREVVGITGIKYGEKIEREASYGKGRYAHSIQSGNIAVDGEITLLQSEVIALQKAGVNQSLLSLNLDAIVNYGNPSEGEAMRTDRIIGIRFTEDVREWKQGDKRAEITLPFLALRVVSGV
ncbi:hypothetical protein HX004_10175 [Myroides sp. 1354]|uniref:hypothetical protein n=1 Tax=unclassified Myroides TaxID=2642485 RepID=UPI00257881C6|nr:MULTISPECIES: hypothetical protein [unclassified Myroides]MDM1045255.1 hypothetical protein [Myroides sp. R163-1]MDM1056137.1 hypothetical protein [Myroides sp. 1354]MDM1069266.1 hypothetical protein [Myroides sp. 1372]